MIARVWHGVTPASKGDAYMEYLEESGLKAYRSTPGNRGVYVLRRVEGGRAGIAHDPLRSDPGRPWSSRWRR